MYSSWQTKNKPKATSQSIKKQRPRPQWTTDFVDREQFKLSQTEMIQKKAALQSKHRQTAKKQLQQRRKKLQMGIIDDQTRKVYETALISKNIDINPPVRRNLTEMIRYEKQQKRNNTEQGEYDDDQENQQEEEYEESNRGTEKQLREAQNFIKKFQKAKKQQNISRAVEMLTHKPTQMEKDKRASNQPSETRVNNFITDNSAQNYKNSTYNNSKSYNKQRGSQPSQSFSQDDALSSIEDTIKFMEEKLFAAKKTVDEHSRSFISEVDNSSLQSDIRPSNQFSDDQEIVFPTSKPVFKKVVNRVKQVNFNTKQKFLQMQQLQFGQRIAQISQLRINLKDEDSQNDDQCMNTIRRMREMMQGSQMEDSQQYSKRMKENIRDNATPSMQSLRGGSTIQKNFYHLQSEAEVSFSLTANNDEEYQQQSSLMNLSKSKIKGGNNNKGQASYSNKEQVDNSNKFMKKAICKQQQYDDEYEKIRQNLFSCINNSNNNNLSKDTKSSNPSTRTFQKYNQEEEDQQNSEDSLMIRDKINMWKTQLQHQQEPQDEDEDEDEYQENDNFRTTVFTKKPTTTMTKSNIVKQSEEDDQEQEDDDEPYRYNYMAQTAKHHKNTTNNKAQTTTQMPPQQMKKPPIAKKSQTNEKFQQMRKMISNASSQIQKIQIQPLKIQPLTGNGQVMGFDFRGSINIKRNVVSK